MDHRTDELKPQYEVPQMEKHEPLKVVHGTGGGCSSLYYVALYYTT